MNIRERVQGRKANPKSSDQIARELSDFRAGIRAREDARHRERLEAPFKKAAQQQASQRDFEQQQRQAAFKYGLNPDMTPLQGGGVQAVRNNSLGGKTGITESGYKRLAELGRSPQSVQYGAMQDSYNRMGLSGGKNKFSSFGVSFGKQLGDLEAASMRIRNSGKDTQLQEQLSRLKAQKPIMPGYNTPETARSYKTNLRDWEREMESIQSKIANLNV